jgi:hypothetical protein
VLLKNRTMMSLQFIFGWVYVAFVLGGIVRFPFFGLLGRIVSLSIRMLDLTSEDTSNIVCVSFSNNTSSMGKNTLTRTHKIYMSLFLLRQKIWIFSPHSSRILGSFFRQNNKNDSRYCQRFLFVAKRIRKW